MKTLLLIPFYNEESRIDQQAILRYVSEDPELDLLLLDDGSTDATYQMLQDIASQSSQIAVYHSDHNLGKGGIIRDAILHSTDQLDQYDYIGYFDGDLSTPLSYYRILQNRLIQEPHRKMVMGSRRPNTDNNLQVKPYRRWIGRFVASLINSIIGYPFYDTQCGAKLFRTEDLLELVGEPFISSWLFDVELILRLSQMSDTPVEELVMELPVSSWEHKDGSKISYRYFPSMLGEMRKISKRYAS